MKPDVREVTLLTGTREAIKAATPFETYTVSKVETDFDGASIYLEGGTAFAISNARIPSHRRHRLPAPGDTIRLYGKGLGYPFIGLDTEGRGEVFFETPVQHQARVEKERHEREARDRADFIKNLPKYNARIATLRDPFKERMARFQASSPEDDPILWDVTFGEYELSVCIDACHLIDAAEAQTTHATPQEFIRYYNALNSEEHDYNYKAQCALVPAISSDHSGNSHGALTQLAFLYFEEDEATVGTGPGHFRVVQQHGALTGLVGCEAYGCTHQTRREKTPQAHANV